MELTAKQARLMNARALKEKYDTCNNFEEKLEEVQELIMKACESACFHTHIDYVGESPALLIYLSLHFQDVGFKVTTNNFAEKTIRISW